MIKLVITDVDGTIVPKDEVLRKEMLQEITKLQQHGIGYTMATGRVSGLVMDYVRQMNLKLPFIACNGGTIVHGNREIIRKTIPLYRLKPIFHIAAEMGMSLLYSINGTEYAYEETEYVREQQRLFQRYTAFSKFSTEQWNTIQLDKLIVMARVRDGSLDVIEEMCKRLPSEFGYKRYANKAIDILNSEATKENGVRELAKLLGLQLNEIMTIGDDLNDIEMLREAGIGVAVGNAQPQVKATADYITKGECYLGVIEAIEKFCFQNEVLIS